MKREPGAGRRPTTLAPGAPRPPGPLGVGERGETQAGEGGNGQDRSRTLQTQEARRPLTGKPQEDPGSAQPDVINARGRFTKIYHGFFVFGKKLFRNRVQWPIRLRIASAFAEATADKSARQG